MASNAKQATRLANRSMMSVRRQSKRPTAFHRLVSLVSVPLPVRVLVFDVVVVVVVVVVVSGVPAPALKTTFVQPWRVSRPRSSIGSLVSIYTVLYFTLPIGSLFGPISTSTVALLAAFDLMLFLTLSSSSTLLSADVVVRDEDVGREQIDDERPTFEWSSPFSTSCKNTRSKFGLRYDTEPAYMYTYRIIQKKRVN